MASEPGPSNLKPPKLSARRPARGAESEALRYMTVAPENTILRDIPMSEEIGCAKIPICENVLPQPMVWVTINPEIIMKRSRNLKAAI